MGKQQHLSTRELARDVASIIIGQDAEVDADASVLDGLHSPVEGLGHAYLHTPAVKIASLPADGSTARMRLTVPDSNAGQLGSWILTLARDVKPASQDEPAPAVPGAETFRVEAIAVIRKLASYLELPEPETMAAIATVDDLVTGMYDATASNAG